MLRSLRLKLHTRGMLSCSLYLPWFGFCNKFMVCNWVNILSRLEWYLFTKVTFWQYFTSFLRDCHLNAFLAYHLVRLWCEGCVQFTALSLLQQNNWFLPLAVPTTGHNASKDAMLVRDTFKAYFVNESAVKWQWDKIYKWIEQLQISEDFLILLDQEIQSLWHPQSKLKGVIRTVASQITFLDSAYNICIIIFSHLFQKHCSVIILKRSRYE